MNKYSQLQIEMLIDLEETEKLFDIFNSLVAVEAEIEECKNRIAVLKTLRSGFGINIFSLK